MRHAQCERPAPWPECLANQLIMSLPTYFIVFSELLRVNQSPT
jgi:hypothetical protein